MSLCFSLISVRQPQAARNELNALLNAESVVAIDNVG